MFHVEQRSSGGNQASGEELFHVEHCPAILTVRLQHYAIRLRRNLDCGLLNFAAWTPTPREIHGGARCSTWNKDSSRHLLTNSEEPSTCDIPPPGSWPRVFHVEHPFGASRPVAENQGNRLKR